MMYRFNDDNTSLLDRLCKINNVDASNLDISDFNKNENIKIIDDFKELLLSLKDKRFLLLGIMIVMEFVLLQLLKSY